MPTFSTGNTAWDQGLGNLSGALFPDPSKVAQAGYYGAEQRKAQLESSKIRDQMARQQVADQAANTLTMPATSYAPSPEGPNMPPIMQPPGAAAPPAPAPPSLSATVAPGPAAAAPPPSAASAAPAYNPPIPPPPSTPASPAPPGTPSPGPPSSVTPAALNAAGAMPPPAPTQAGTVGANMTPAGLSSLFAQGGGAVPDGGGTVRLDQGTPPPVSSPAQGSGAPPAPNNTASDGSVPTNDAVSGIFHPGSITPPGGGRKTTGPADANGAPAKPMITAAQWVNMQVAAGHDANQALVTWRAMISSAYDTGQIDENTYHHMMGAADPSIINTDSTNATNIKRTGMEQAGATTRTGMEQAGATTRAGMPTTFVADDPNDPTKGHYVPLAQQQGPGGTPSFAPAVTTTAAQPVTTQPGGPGTPTFSSNTGQAQRSGTPLYEPTSTDQFTAAQQQQIVNERDPAKRQQLIERFTSAQSVTPKTTTPNESVQNANIVDQRLALRMPVPTGTGIAGTGIGGGAATNSLDAASSPELAVTLQNLTDQYFTYSPDRSVRGNRVAAADAAIQQLIEEHRIDPSQSRTTGIMPGANISSTINKPTYNAATKATEPQPRFRVDLLDPNTKKPVAPGAVVNIPMKPASLSSVVAPTATKGSMPAGALGPAPAGAADGTTGTTNTGQRSVVRGGWVFPAASAAAPGPGGGG